MGGTIMAVLRRRRRAVIQWVTAMLMFPTLLGLIPAPELPEAAALERDLAAFTCSFDPPAVPDHHGGGQQGQHDQCIVCASACPACAPVLASGVPSAVPPQIQGGESRSCADEATSIFRTVLRQGSPPRAPPSSLNV